MPGSLAVVPWHDLGGDHGRDRAAQEKRIAPRWLRDTTRVVAFLEGKGGVWLASGAHGVGGPRAAGVARAEQSRVGAGKEKGKGEKTTLTGGPFPVSRTRGEPGRGSARLAGLRDAGPGELLDPRGREKEEVAGWAGAEVWASREGVGRAGWVVGLV